VRAGSR